MTSATARHPTLQQRKAVGWWLVAVAVLVAAMVTLGGLTRLTGSGLSITQWQPVTGIVPPMSDHAWQAEFERYRQIPQYRFENRGMSLAAFQFIYWWEWTHRFLGRLLGAVFLLPFIFFAATGAIPRSRWPRMALLFALGGLQGFVGWWMVESGLEVRVSVSQYRLAIHLGVALLLFGALLWTALEYLRRPISPPLDFPPPRVGEVPSAARLRGTSRAVTSPSGSEFILGPAFGRTRGGHLPHVGGGKLWLGWSFVALVYAQMLLGALVAGLHAGLIYNTWPSMDGRVLPEGAFALHPWWINFFENAGLAQFDHRMCAYVAALGAAALWLVVRRTEPKGDALRASSNVLVAIVVAQIVLGIATLLNQAPLALAASHQAGAVALLAAGLWHVFELSRAAPPYAAAASA
ncbi:MAG TPA: COX15/CtaA family protein [Rhizomicrobium sp.]|nr:COX15/CtaA family protein [Rhizomicrobium sp.]